ncbi:epoxyqueuosine reductase [candidate division KSB3 bacterium]|uniref:Epoxyqueuosine reductase n=1 Tax=candidate division KSB3 bacterium TaxID=2044937 RepID=A0A9D5JUL6_9BACT|nr:epoxyqueuosine reductase [candidate division KSB3 bacterium]MBD3324306.1 epoxyqueuosine reductase [candidate division KSB3 bacterium]
MRETVAEDLRTSLISQGAACVGYADLADVPPDARQGYPCGVSIAVALNPAIIAGITEGPTLVYEEEYNRVNRRLDALAKSCTAFLQQQGFEAVSAVATVKSLNETNLFSALPHKTVATRAGLGWVGKCALLVTKAFGSAVRLTTVLTDANLGSVEAVDESSCGTCRACVDVCPVKAPKGHEWQAGMPREAFFDAVACYRQTMLWISERRLTHHICGMCIVACPWTQEYLKNAVD